MAVLGPDVITTFLGVLRNLREQSSKRLDSVEEHAVDTVSNYLAGLASVRPAILASTYCELLQQQLTCCYATTLRWCPMTHPATGVLEACKGLQNSQAFEPLLKAVETKFWSPNLGSQQSCNPTADAQELRITRHRLRYQTPAECPICSVANQSALVRLAHCLAHCSHCACGWQWCC